MLKPVFYFLIYQFVTRQDGVPKGTPPYPPVTHDISSNIFILTLNKIHFATAIISGRSSYSPGKPATSSVIFSHARKFPTWIDWFVATLKHLTYFINQSLVVLAHPIPQLSYQSLTDHCHWKLAQN